MAKISGVGSGNFRRTRGGGSGLLSVGTGLAGGFISAALPAGMFLAATVGFGAIAGFIGLVVADRSPCSALDTLQLDAALVTIVADMAKDVAVTTDVDVCRDGNVFDVTLD